MANEPDDQLLHRLRYKIPNRNQATPNAMTPLIVLSSVSLATESTVSCKWNALECYDMASALAVDISLD